MNSSPQDSIPGQRVVDFSRKAVESALQNPLFKPLVPTSMGYFPEAEGQKFETTAGIDQAILIYCAKGRGWCDIASQKLDIVVGNVLIIPPFTPCAFGADLENPWTISWVHLAGDNVQPLLAKLGITREKPVVELGDDPKVLALFEDALTVAENGETCTTTNLFHTGQSVGRLLALINWRRSRGSLKPADAGERVKQCIEFMKQNLCEPLQLDRLARVANLSHSHFHASFQKETGHSPLEYLIKLRMDRACHLLASTERPIKEIAAEVGYEDPLYFSRAFRTHRHTSPTEYREQNRSG